MRTSKHRRLAVFGVLALALSATAGLTSGAQAAKHKKKNANTISLSESNLAIPDQSAAPNAPAGIVDATFQVGKKFKGKQIGNVDVTVQVTGSGANYLNNLNIRVSAPNGRNRFISVPSAGPAPNQSYGPLRLTANTNTDICFSPPATPCEDPENSLYAPYAGTANDDHLPLLEGGPMKGTWRVRFYDSNPTLTGVVNLVKLDITAAKPVV